MKTRCLGLGLALLASMTFLATRAEASEVLPGLPPLRLTPPFASELVEMPDTMNAERAPKWVPGQPLPPGMQPPPEYRYTPGDLLPEGYHIEERPRRGLLVSGYLVAGIPYGFGLLVGATKQFRNELHWLAVPVAGPFLTFALRDRACNEIGETAFDSWHCVWDRTSEWFLIADGVLQAAGATLVIVGYSSTTPFAVRDDEAKLWIGPTLVGGGGGLGAFGVW